MSSLKEKLENECELGQWSDLSLHLKRDAIIHIHESLDIVSVALAVAEDNSEMISSLISGDKLSKPNVDEFNHWQESNPLFKCIIVQPFVVIQLHTEDTDGR